MKEASQRLMCVAQKRLCVSSLMSNSHLITNLINHIIPASATQQNTLSAVLRLHFRLARCGIEFPHGRQTDPLYNRQDTVQVLWQPCSQGLSCSVWTCRKDPGNERNLKIAFKTIGLFRVAPSLCFKARLSVKPLIWRSFFILMQMNLTFTSNILHVASFWKWEFLALRNGLLIWALFSCSEAIKQEVYIVTRAFGSYGCAFP